MSVYSEVNFTPVQHIEIRNGQARLVGRNLKVKMVISRLIHSEDTTLEEVMKQYHLSRAEVYACLAYYYDHQSVIDEHFLEQDKQVREFAIPFGSLKTRWQAHQEADTPRQDEE